MNYKKMMDAQKTFEKSIGYEGEDRIKKKILSLIVETGEALNERPSYFKFWSKRNKSSTQKNAEHYAQVYNKPEIEIVNDVYLEELVDMFSFILSLGLDLDIEVDEINPGLMVRDFQDHADLYLLFSESVLNLYTLWSFENDVIANNGINMKEGKATKQTFNEILSRFYALVIACGYTLSDIEDAYYSKNSINVERQIQGY